MRNRCCAARKTGLIRAFSQNCDEITPEPFEGALPQLQEKVAYWQRELHLGEWQIIPQFVAPNPERTARIWVHDDFHIATMEMGDDVEAEEWDWVVVHELVHLILFPTSTLCDTMCEHLDRHQSEILEALLTNAEETAINRLTEAIVGERLPVVWEEG